MKTTHFTQSLIALFWFDALVLLILEQPIWCKLEDIVSENTLIRICIQKMCCVCARLQAILMETHFLKTGCLRVHLLAIASCAATKLSKSIPLCGRSWLSRGWNRILGIVVKTLYIPMWSGLWSDRTSLFTFDSQHYPLKIRKMPTVSSYVSLG